MGGGGEGRGVICPELGRGDGTIVFPVITFQAGVSGGGGGGGGAHASFQLLVHDQVGNK